MKVQSIYLTFAIIFMAFGAHSQKKYELTTPFDEKNIPAAPNYQSLDEWAAHPKKEDPADLVPKNRIGLKDQQSVAEADVFFIYPTIYTQEPNNNYTWNADINDTDLNQAIDDGTIKNQASIFNGSCRVFAPRYRQAHYSAFTSADKESCKKSLDLAYEDIKVAFDKYLENFNEGRPIVIASHSQGTIHAIRLLKDYFDEKPLKKQLVEAYLVGMPIPSNIFKEIPVSKNEKDTGGFVTWNTFAEGYIPTYYKNGLDRATVTNPLSWNTDNPKEISRQKNLGGVGRKFNLINKAVDAQTHEGLLWIGKPHIPGAGLLNIKIWHFADYNLFWMNTRENVALRIKQFKNKQQ